MKPLPHILPAEALKELVLDADIDDERVWVPRGDDVWSLPLLFNVAQGSWANLTRAKGDGVISRHRHPAAVTGFTLEGARGLSGARLDGQSRDLRVRTAGRNAHAGGEAEPGTHDGAVS